jgi:hypothetical protein
MHAPGAGIGTILATCGSVLLNGTQTKEWGWNRRGSGEGPSGQGGRPGRDTMLAKSRSCHGPEPPPQRHGFPFCARAVPTQLRAPQQSSASKHGV